MARIKKCSFCGQETTKLFYANPKCCTKGSCLIQYKNLKHKEKGKHVPKTNIVKNGIKKINDKMLKKMAEYRPLRDKYLSDHPVCEIQSPKCTGGPVELHHKKPRAYYLCDVSVFCSACRSCNSYVESHHQWARENGFKLDHL